jgi:hypothetical protein
MLENALDLRRHGRGPHERDTGLARGRNSPYHAGRSGDGATAMAMVAYLFLAFGVLHFPLDASNFARGEA